MGFFAFFANAHVRGEIRTLLFHARVRLGLALWVAGVGAVQADYSRTPEGQAFIQKMHTTHGFEAASVARSLASAAKNPPVLRLIRPPSAPAARSWQAYRKRFVETHRIEGGLRFWQQHRVLLRAASERYGVPEEIIVAIIGVETVYGRHTGDFQTLSALATLAFDYPPRSALFLRELEHLFLLARLQGRDPSAYYGSYAGALGIPQFLPSSVLNYAVDFDGDGRIDLETSVADAVGSVARYLAEHGWEPGAPIASRVFPGRPDGLPPLLEAGLLPRLDRETLQQAGITAPPTASGPFAVIDLPTPGASTEYWLAHRNFYVISRYNRSTFYAMSVHQLAQTLRERRS